MDLEAIVKEKIKLQKENKELKQKIDWLKTDLSFKNKEADKLKDKLKEITRIAGGIKVTFLSRIKRW